MYVCLVVPVPFAAICALAVNPLGGDALDGGGNDGHSNDAAAAPEAEADVTTAAMCPTLDLLVALTARSR